MKKLKYNLIKIIIAILALFIIIIKPTYALLNADEDQTAVETQLGKELGLGTEDDESDTSSDTSKTVQDFIEEEKKKNLLEDAKKLITIDSMLFNEEPLVDVNFFDDSEAVKEIKKKNPKAFIIQIREGIKMWYYIIRNIAIMVMVVVLMYTAIRMLLNIYTESPENKARYKEMMIAWAKSLAILIIMHLIIYTVIAFNTDIINTIKNAAQIDDPRLQNLNVILLERALDIRLSVSFPATILYVMVTFLTMQYFYIYLKRFILVLILIVSGPFIIIKTAYESTGKAVSKAYSKWLYDLIINVLEQSVHAIFYAIFVKTLFEGAMENLIGFLLFWFVLKSMLKLSTTALKLFKFNSKSGAMGSMPLERKGFVTFGSLQLAASTAKTYFDITTRPAKFIGMKAGGMALAAGGAATKLIADKLSINLDDVHDTIDETILGNKLVSKYLFKDETGEETRKLLEIRKDARRKTDSSDYSKELSKKYISNKIGKYTANLGMATKITAMRAARILGVPFALVKDLTDGQDISFTTLELLKMTDWKKAKKDYEKKKKKTEKASKKYKKQITAHDETIKDKARIRSSYKDLLAEERRRRNNNNNIESRDRFISAEEIKTKLRRIHYLDINAFSLDRVVKSQMQQLNIEKKEDLTDTKIRLILDRVIEKSKLDDEERRATLEKISQRNQNRFIDEDNRRNPIQITEQPNNNEQVNQNINLNTPPNIIPENTESRNQLSNTSAPNTINHTDNSNRRNENHENSENNENTSRNNSVINDIINQRDNNETQNSNNANSNENASRRNIHDISEARAKREGSKYIAEELSKIITSVIAEDENIARIGNSINALKDSNEKRKSKLNINKFIDNL